MKIDDILVDKFPYDVGAEIPSNIIDYRSIDAKGQYKSYVNTNGKRVRFWNKKPITHIMLCKNNKVIVFYYGDHNIISWRELLTILFSKINDELQTEPMEIAVKDGGYLINRNRETGSWSGNRNKYSNDVKRIVQALVDRGIATLSMPIWIGNRAAHSGEHIGTIGKILSSKNLEDRNRITVYHGTDTLRLEQIMKNGLRALPFENRIWNNTSIDKKRPEHREDSIYFTSSKPQAEYYANKAVNIDRKRFSSLKKYKIRTAIDGAKRAIEIMQAQLDRFSKMTPEQIAAEDEHDRRYNRHIASIETRQSVYPELIEKKKVELEKAEAFNIQYNGKIEPVILEITLYKKEFEKLMADDDHLRNDPDAKADDWISSLSNFGQIAFRGVIPPNRIKVIAKGADAQRKSR